MNMRRLWIGIAVMALAGCGGGGGGDSPPPVPQLRSGELDAAYGSGGIALLSGAQGLTDMVVAPDGSVFVTGEAIVKLDPRGAVDAAYGTGGRFTLRSFSPVLDDAGSLYVLSGLEVVKLDPAGRLDVAFGVNGYATIDAAWREFSVVPARLARDPDGNLYVAAFSSTLPVALQVAKLDRAGRRVPGYGDGGTLTITTGRRFNTSSMAFDAQGNLYVGGVEFILAAGTNSYLTIAKITPDGRLEPDFGVTGVWADRTCATFRGVTSIAMDPIGQLVIGGECHPFTLPLGRATVRKLDSRGNPLPFRDPGLELFGISVAPGPVVEAREAIAILANADGTLHVAGNRLSGVGCYEPAVAKLAADGTVVADFGLAGVVGLGSIGLARRFGRDAQGRLYVGANIFPGCPLNATPAPDFAVYRLGG